MDNEKMNVASSFFLRKVHIRHVSSAAVYFLPKVHVHHVSNVAAYFLPKVHAVTSLELPSTLAAKHMKVRMFCKNRTPKERKKDTNKQTKTLLLSPQSEKIRYLYKKMCTIFVKRKQNKQTNKQTNVMNPV